MDKIIRVEKPIAAYEMVLGKGAVINLQSATSPLLVFLKKKYSEDPTCLSGDIDLLFRVQGEGLKPFNKYYKQ